MDKKLEIGLLLDYYAVLLTPHQRQLLEEYCELDLSLAEIAQRYGVSRQAVLDTLRRGQSQMRDWEEKLGLIRKEKRLQALFSKVQRQILCVQRGQAPLEALEDVRSQLSQFLEGGDERDGV